jgi:hypothetical protein
VLLAGAGGGAGGQDQGGPAVSQFNVNAKPSPWLNGESPRGAISGRVAVERARRAAGQARLEQRSVLLLRWQFTAAGLAGGVAALLIERFLDRVVRGG